MDCLKLVDLNSWPLVTLKLNSNSFHPEKDTGFEDALMSKMRTKLELDLSSMLAGHWRQWRPSVHYVEEERD